MEYIQVIKVTVMAFFITDEYACSHSDFFFGSPVHLSYKMFLFSPNLLFCA